MGTSVSQPSPSKGEDGKVWKKAKQQLENTTTGKEAITSISNAITSQFNNAESVIVDDGVRAIYRNLIKLPDKKLNANETIDFLSQSRNEINASAKNSFFSEIALSAAAKSCQMDKDKNHSFIQEYFTSVFNYYISRDLPATFGSEGLLNVEEVRNRINQISREIRSETNNVTSLEEAITKILRK